MKKMTLATHISTSIIPITYNIPTNRNITVSSAKIMGGLTWKPVRGEKEILDERRTSDKRQGASRMTAGFRLSGGASNKDIARFLLQPIEC